MNWQSPEFVFVVGSGRSGTTGLARTIASLPNIGYTPELKFFTGAMSTRRRFEPFDSPQRVLAYLRHACETVARPGPSYTPRLAQIIARAPERLPARLQQPCSPILVYQFVFRELIRGLTNGEPIVVLHTPGDLFFVRLIEKVVGPARFVFTYRDSRSFVASAMRGTRQWFGNDVTAAAYWNLAMASGEQLAVKHNAVFVRQEDLLLHPERTLATLERRLGLPHLSSAQVEHVNSSFGPDAITASSVGRYRERLTDRDIARITFLTRRCLAKHYSDCDLTWDPSILGPLSHRASLFAHHAFEYQRLRGLNRLREIGWGDVYDRARRVKRWSARRSLP